MTRAELNAQRVAQYAAARAAFLEDLTDLIAMGETSRERIAERLGYRKVSTFERFGYRSGAHGLLSRTRRSDGYGPGWRRR